MKIGPDSSWTPFRQWDGQIWLIPDKSATTKEPIVVFVDGMGATIQRVDHPEQRKQLDKDVADSAFSSYLDTAKSLDQYVVFEVKPSGIGLFQDLVKSARDQGFDVGYDALEEDKNPHLSPLPSIEEAEAFVRHVQLVKTVAAAMPRDITPAVVQLAASGSNNIAQETTDKIA